MIKINYPKDPGALEAFRESYFKSISGAIGDYRQLEKDLSKVSKSDGKGLDLEGLLLCGFGELLELDKKIAGLKNESAKKRMRKALNYTVLQPAIASFFMAALSSSLQSCFYCNIDSIYAFSEMGAYRDSLHFLNKAFNKELQSVHGIGPKTAGAILAARKSGPLASVRDFGLNAAQVASLEAARGKSTHNHFTLDHFFDKGSHNFICASLYNFVPCCYACNSKFKGTKKLYSAVSGGSSPSSERYGFPSEALFKVYLEVEERDVKKLEDFTVELEEEKHLGTHSAFIEVLKLRGRYAFFKKEALRLLLLKRKYPEAALEQLARDTGQSFEKLKRDLFGADLFEEEYDHAALVKYRRDIARSISLPGVREV